MVNNRRIAHSLLLSSLILSSAFGAENLGIIEIDSTTIDDRFASKHTEISSTSTISGESVDHAHTEKHSADSPKYSGDHDGSKNGRQFKDSYSRCRKPSLYGRKTGGCGGHRRSSGVRADSSVNIDLDNIESIKVIKGGASYLFGDDALSGAVIITTKKGAKYHHNFAAVERGSFGYQKLLARTGYANDDISFHLQASERKAEGYHEDSDYSAQYLNGKIQYYIDDTSDLTFGLEASKRKKDSHGTVGGETEAQINPESVFTGDMESRDYTRKFDVDLLKLFLTYSKDFPTIPISSSTATYTPMIPTTGRVRRPRMETVSHKPIPMMTMSMTIIMSKFKKGLKANTEPRLTPLRPS
jgi:iron complex outermembrane recepter protein